jgi:hypothetical protein
VTRRALLAAATASSLATIAIAVSGGIVLSAGGVRLSARSPRSAALAALALGSAWLITAARARSIAADLSALSARVERHAAGLVVALALGTGALALGHAAFSSAGADASGYLSQAAMWARLDWRTSDSLGGPDWPAPGAATAPLGWRPAIEPGWQVPTYAPGLPLLMALPLALAGDTGAAMVVVVSAVLAVWAAGALARGLGGGVAGVVAASLLAASPTFLYQALQPMSDVPVTAAWLICWWAVFRGRPGAAGLAAAAAILVRPNLAPLAVVPFAVVALAARSAPLVPALRFAAPVSVAGLVIATLQYVWYGSPLSSGYGRADELFARANAWPNARLFARWMGEAEGTMVAAAAAAVVLTLAFRWFRVVGPAEGRAVGWDRTGTAGGRSRFVVAGMGGFAAGGGAWYLVYAGVERWW